MDNNLYSALLFLGGAAIIINSNAFNNTTNEKRENLEHEDTQNSTDSSEISIKIIFDLIKI